MSVASLGEKAPVLTAQIRMPAFGNWSAELTVDTASILAGKQTLTIVDGMSLTGYVRRCGVFMDKLHVQLVGGAGGLEKKLTPKHYTRVPASLLVKDILTEVGETYAYELPENHCEAWGRPIMSAGAALTAIAEQVSQTWRVDAGGRVVFEVPTWPEISRGDYDLLDAQPEESWALIGTETPWMEAGTTFIDRKVRMVVHTLGPVKARTEVFFEPI